MCSGNSTKSFCQRCFSFILPTKPGATKPKWKIIGLMTLTMIGSAYSITFLFPFLPALIISFGYTEVEKGRYAGIVASMFFVGRVVGSYFWGWLSDRRGRKPVIILTLTLTCISNIAFGFAGNIYLACIGRFFNGLVNGLVGLVRSVLYESSDNTNQAVGMSAIAFGWGVGIVIGPLFSGHLSSPAIKYPTAFSSDGVFAKFPFLLPSLMAAAVCVIPTIFVIVFFEETLRSRQKESGNPDEKEPEDLKDEGYVPDVGTIKEGLNKEEDLRTSHFSLHTSLGDPLSNLPIQETSSLYDMKRAKSQSLPFAHYLPELSKKHSVSANLLSYYDGEANTDPAWTKSENKIMDAPEMESKVVQRSGFCQNLDICNILRIRNVQFAIGLFVISSFAVIGWVELFAVWASTNAELGGLNFTSSHIGNAIGLSAVALLPLQVWLFPKLEATIGAIRTFQLSCGFLIVCSSLIPVLQYIQHIPALMWTLLMVMRAGQEISISTCFGACGLFINNSVQPSMVGKVNGLAMTFTAMARAFAPFIAGVVFSWSVSHGIRIGFPFNCFLTFFLFSFVFLISNILSIFFPKELEKQNKLSA